MIRYIFILILFCFNSNSVWSSTAEMTVGKSSGIGIGYILGPNLKSMEVLYEKIDGQAIFEGDIVLGTVAELEASTPISSPYIKNAFAISDNARRWPDNNVPYMIDSALSQTIQTEIRDAINIWNSQTNITLVERIKNAPSLNYIEFMKPTNPGTCNSFIGMEGNRQVINIGSSCKRGGVIHEIGHALGLYHEHTRDDRHKHIRILSSNIEIGREHNFKQRFIGGQHVGPYDFDSIMHYVTTAFGKLNVGNIRSTTIERIATSTSIPTGKIGQRIKLSQGDIAEINNMYPNKPVELTNGLKFTFSSPSANSIREFFIKIPASSKFEGIRVDLAGINSKANFTVTDPKQKIYNSSGPNAVSNFVYIDGYKNPISGVYRIQVKSATPYSNLTIHPRIMFVEKINNGIPIIIPKNSIFFSKKFIFTVPSGVAWDEVLFELHDPSGAGNSDSGIVIQALNKSWGGTLKGIDKIVHVKKIDLPVSTGDLIFSILFFTATGTNHPELIFKASIIKSVACNGPYVDGEYNFTGIHTSLPLELGTTPGNMTLGFLITMWSGVGSINHRVQLIASGGTGAVIYDSGATSDFTKSFNYNPIALGTTKAIMRVESSTYPASWYYDLSCPK